MIRATLKGAGSCAHSQEHSLRVDHGFFASFSLEEGWTVVRRRKEKKVVQKEEKTRKGKAPEKKCAKLGVPVYFVVLHPCGQGRKLPFSNVRI